MGGDVTVTGGQVNLEVKVQAPSWMDVDERLIIYLSSDSGVTLNMKMCT